MIKKGGFRSNKIKKEIGQSKINLVDSTLFIFMHPLYIAPAVHCSHVYFKVKRFDLYFNMDFIKINIQ